jgi:CheY-like chemotaxis protein
MAEMSLHDFGYETLAASDTTEALEFLHSGQPIDAMFTDIYLKSKVSGGCELGIEALKIRPGLKVLYTTGNRVTPEMLGMFVDGKHFLAKPYTPLQLRDSIDQLGDMG